MIIRRIRTITYVTITTAPLGKEEYENKSFEAVVNDGGTITHFKDWLNGNPTNGYIIDIEGYTYTHGVGYDIKLFNESFSDSNHDYLINRFYQSLMIHYGELKYSYMNTTSIGIPYLKKKSKVEMDLILKKEISQTVGVERIIEFNSQMVDRKYKLDFKVKAVEGDIIWLTIDQ